MKIRLLLRNYSSPWLDTDEILWQDMRLRLVEPPIGGESGKDMKQHEEKAVLSKEPESPTDCTHHWVIETPVGPVSQGNCKICGEGREFDNFPTAATYWEDDVTLDQVSSGASFNRKDTQSTIDEESDR